MGGVVGLCKPIFVSNPQPSYFGLLLDWVAVAWLGFGVMTIFGFPHVLRCRHDALGREGLLGHHEPGGV